MQARVLQSYKQKDIADNCNISSSVVSQYESGKTEPSHDTINNISQFLSVNSNFFYIPKPRMYIKNIAFRKAKTTHRDEVLRARYLVEYLTEIKELIIDKNANLPAFNIPKFDYTISVNKDSINYDIIENIAEATREFWKIGKGPISDMIKLLESNGIFVFKLDSEMYAKVDAFSWFATNHNQNLPIVFLNRNKSAVRSRFDIAHELAHIILHSDIDIETLDNEQLNIIEKEADYFAGCFLLPAKPMFDEFISHNINALINLKKRWKVSISAIAHRLNVINIINDYQYQSIQVQISKAGYRKHEPLDNGEIPHEKMFLFTEITNALSDKYNFNDIVYIKSVYNGLHLPKNRPYSLVPNFGLKTLH
jgi:Zn-dependent peptidase ImmA (M78 family)